VGAHVALEVEISELISLLEVEESRKLRVGVDLATILLILEAVSADILGNVTSHIGASHLGTRRLIKELSKLIRNLGGLHESRGSAISALALSTRALALSSLELTGPLLLESSVLRLEGGNENAKLLELGNKLHGLLSKIGISLGLDSRGGNSRFLGNRSYDNGGRGISLGGLGLLGLHDLLGSGSRGSSSDNGGGSGSGFGSSVRLRFVCSSHLIIQYINIYFLSCLTQIIFIVIIIADNFTFFS
jgi:hypothetical protein